MRAGERRGLPGAREQAVEVGHDALRADARPEGLDAAGVAFVAREGQRAEVVGRVQAARVVRVVVRVHRGLVGHDEDVAEAGELLRDRRDVDVAHQDVLVLFLDQLVAGRDDDFDHVLAGRQHRRCRRRDSIRCSPVQLRLSAGLPVVGSIAGNARELVHAVVRRGLDLVQLRPAVVALELRVVGERLLVAGCIRRVEPLLAVLQGCEERARGILARAVHVGT